MVGYWTTPSGRQSVVSFNLAGFVLVLQQTWHTRKQMRVSRSPRRLFSCPLQALGRELGLNVRGPRTSNTNTPTQLSLTGVCVPSFDFLPVCVHTPQVHLFLPAYVLSSGLRDPLTRGFLDSQTREFRRTGYVGPISLSCCNPLSSDFESPSRENSVSESKATVRL